MCRWLAYSGGPIHLDEIVTKPENSIIDQSLHSQLGATTTNGDGFGIGWYGSRDTPGIYKDVQPAWNDTNLHALAEQIKSNLFIAHIRATTGTAVQRSNCHPFHFKNWIFVHNGLIRDFEIVKKELMMEVAPEFFPFIQGSTDSEIMFFLALTLGLRENIKVGISRMVGLVERIGKSHQIDFPMQMSLGISDGESIFGFRYSSEGKSRSLFHSERIEALKEIAPDVDRFTADTRALVSEPLNHIVEAWIPIPESSFVRILSGEVEIEKFEVE